MEVLVNNLSQTIQFGSIFAIDAKDKHPRGYYMVIFTSFPYTLQENKSVDAKVIYYDE